MAETPSDAADYRYDAFISYSRRDSAFATRLAKALEAYHPPKDLPVPQRHLSIFRDAEDFTGNEYFRGLDESLAGSRTMLLICSPHARDSRFVNDEVARFARLRDPTKIFPIWLSGLPNNEASGDREYQKAFPETLMATLPRSQDIPLAYDFRPFAEGHRNLTGRIHRDAWYKMLADIYGLSRDVVEQRDRRRRRRVMQIRGAIAAVVAIALVFVGGLYLQSSEGARHASYADGVQRAYAEYQATNLAHMGRLLDQWAPHDSRRNAALAGFEWYYLDRLRRGVGGVTAVSDAVRTAAFSADGKWLATSREGDVTLWHAGDWTRAAGLATQAHAVSSLAFSADGRLLATAGTDLPVRTWDVSTGKLVEEISAFANADAEEGTTVEQITFARRGPRLAGIKYRDAEKVVQVWDTAARRMIGEVLGAATANASGLFVALAHDGSRVAYSSSFGVEVRSLPAGDPVPGFEGLEDLPRATTVAFSPDGAWLAAGDRSGRISIYDVSLPSRPEIVRVAGEVVALAFAPDGRTLASATADDVVQTWEPASGALRNTLKLAKGITEIAFTPGGGLATIGAGGVQIWDILSPPERQDIDALGLLALRIAPSPRSDEVLLAGAGTMAIFDTVTGTERARLDELGGAVVDAALAPDGALVAFASDDPAVDLWNPVTMAVERLAGHTGGVRAVAFSPDGTLLASAGADRVVRLRQVADRRPLPTVMTGHAGIITALAFAPDGKTLVTGSDDRTIRLWEIATGRQLAASEDFTKPAAPADPDQDPFIAAVRFSPDGRLLAAATGDGPRLWQISWGGLRPLATLYGHKDRVADVAFSPDGRRLATASADTSVKLWDTSSMLELITVWEARSDRDVPGFLRDRENQVNAVGFSRDGKTLLTGLVDGTIRLRRGTDAAAAD